jgi:hypothetical protein
MAQFGFCGGTYQSQSPNIDAEDCINLYPEAPESAGAKTSVALLHTPGTSVFCQLPEASVPSLYTINGRTFAAATNLYEIFQNKTFSNRGNLGAAPLGPTQMVSSRTQLLAMNNGNLYVLTLATNGFAAVNMGQFVGSVSQIGYADGYFIVTIAGTNTFQVSNLNDATTWSGLNIAAVSLFPDNITSFISDHRELWFYSGKKTVVYYNAGAGFPPFIPVQGAFIENGSGAAFATAQLDNSVFWLDQDERGSMIARRANGYSPSRISTFATEFAWQNYPVNNDAVGYAYQDQGHTFWVVRFPAANATWVYDVATGLWHKRGYWNTNTGLYSAHHSTCHTFNFFEHLVGDWSSGQVYQQSINTFTDAGVPGAGTNPLRWLRRSPTVHRENEFIYYHKIEFDVEVGLGPQPPLLDGDGQPRDPQIMLRWSDNGAKTWSNTYLLNCGQAGKYNARATKRALGRARRRVWEASGTDPIPWRIANAYLTATPGFEPQERLGDQLRKMA